MKQLIWIFFLLVLVMQVSAFEVDDLNSQSTVQDFAELFSVEEKEQIENYIIELERNSTLEFAVVTIPSLEGRDVSMLSLEIAEKLGIGKEDVDNGLLLFIALEERAYRIEVGYGLEASIPDVIAIRVGREILVPAFQQEAYAQGVLESLRVLGGYATQDESTISAFEQKESIPWDIIIILGVVLVIMLLSGGRGFLIFLPPMGGPRMGGPKGPMNGGGFGGFGGGGFGGGGAGGRW